MRKETVRSDRAIQKNVWLSSWVLSVSLLGDALLYIVLPINADAFGISIATAGFLLAVNRIIRTFTYNLVLNFGQAVGPKKLAVIAGSSAVLSTFGYAIFEGVFLLSLSRIIWGLSYAGLLIVTLHFASLNSAKTGTRLGLSRSVEQVGPLIAMLVGAWLVASVGPRDIFLYMGLASVLGIVLAVFIVDIKDTETLQNKPVKNFSIPLPKSIDTLIFWIGFGIDGVFTVTVVLMWAEVSGPQTAMIVGASILAIRRLSEMILGPVSGWISDRFGNGVPLIVMLVLCVAGFFPYRMWCAFDGMRSAGPLQRGAWNFVSCRSIKTLRRAENILSDTKPDLARYWRSSRAIFNRVAVSHPQP